MNRLSLWACLAQVDSPVHSGDHSAPATVTWPRRIQKASSEAFQKEDTKVSLYHILTSGHC